MKLSDIGELSLLAQLRERFRVHAKDVIAGIGDDAAVIVPRSQFQLLTTDIMTEGVHFDFSFTTPFQLGFKLVSVNVSDIYAMGGTPRFVLLDVAVDRKSDAERLESFFAGVQEAMARYRVKLLGGDLSSSRSGMVVSGTLIGYAGRPVMRSGAKPGDRIYVTGTLGDSACGLALLKVIRRPLSLETGERMDKPLAWSVMRPLIGRHLLPEARKPGRIARVATAMIDVSDGLFIDLSRLCDESGTGARIYERRLPLSSFMKKAASLMGTEPYTLATSGGEDYELLFTARPGKKVAAECIGEITEEGRVVVGRDGVGRTFSAEGYQHWR